MEPILTIDNLNSFGGNMLRQGDKSQLKYRLRDVGNKNLSISSKPCQVKMYGRNYTTVVYETTTTVSTENTVSFTIDKVLPKGTFYLEFTVGDYIFPTDHKEFFEITPSGKGMEANIIEIVGKDVLIREVKSQVDTELQPLVTSLESAQQAETQRVSAESARVSAEAQRKIDHANRSAELDGKADKVVIKNLIENGNFESTSPIPTGTTLSDGVIEYTGVNELSRFEFRAPVILGHKYYITFKVKYISDKLINGAFSLTGVGFNFYYHNQLGEPNSWTTISDIVDSNLSVNTSAYVYMQGTAQYDDFILIDLTETFGAGNEPTKEEMDELIKVTGYIDGEYALNNKEMLIWTLALIRRNKNAIITLGGA